MFSEKDRIIIRLQKITDAESEYLEQSGWSKTGQYWVETSSNLKFDRMTAILKQKAKDQEFIYVQSYFISE